MKVTDEWAKSYSDSKDLVLRDLARDLLAARSALRSILNCKHGNGCGVCTSIARSVLSQSDTEAKQ